MALNLDTLGLSATITAQGITAPDYQTILSTLTDYFLQIYGSDAYLAPDSKDGQMVALIALAIHDANTTAIAVYQAFSPTTALSDALTRNVKINGIVRHAAVNSTADLTLSGAVGTTILNGSAKDTQGVIWNLPETVSIGTDGSVVVTATCDQSGAVAAGAETINLINTPTRGWVAVTNRQAANIGAAAETDAALRQRQSRSVAMASLTPFDALDGAIAGIDGVTRHKLYENDSAQVDDNGLPPHAISAIIEGGDVTQIAETLRGKKGQGVTTYGSQAVTVLDTYGNHHRIHFSRPVDVPIYVAISLRVFTGYTTAVDQQMKQAIADYINGLSIGDDVLLSRLYTPANLGVSSGGDARYYDITSLALGRSADNVAPTNVTTAYYESPVCLTENISITVAA